MANSAFRQITAIAAVAGGFSGYSAGLGGHRTRPPIYVIGVLVATVIVLILDLDRPSEGFIRVDQQPMREVSVTLVTTAE